MRLTECIIKLLKNFSICHRALQTPEDSLWRQNRLRVEQIWALAVYQTKAGNFCHCATQCLSVDTPTENGDLEKIWSHIPADSCFLCPLGWWTRYFCTETLKYRGNLLRLDIWFCFLCKKRDLKGHLMEVYVIPLTKKMIEANYNSYYESMRWRSANVV